MLPEDVPVPLLPRRQRGPRPAEGRRHQSRLRQLRPQAGRRADLPELRNHLRQGELVHLNITLKKSLKIKVSYFRLTVP